MQKKSFSTPDSVMGPSDKTKVETVEIAGKNILRQTFAPGWKWSTDIGPSAGATTCQVHHLLVAVSGKLTVKAEDGAEITVDPGEVVDVTPGHDAWVVGDKPFVGFDVSHLVFDCNN